MAVERSFRRSPETPISVVDAATEGKMLTMSSPANPLDAMVAVCGMQLRVRFRSGTGRPIVLCNGFGARLEVLDSLVENLDPARPVVRFDVPGTGESPESPIPYSLPYLASVLGRVLDRLEIDDVDVLGLSWGGSLAQQFAFQNPRRCRHLVLIGASTGMTTIPAGPTVLSKMVAPRLCSATGGTTLLDPDLYGGAVREHAVPGLVGRQLAAGSPLGYTHQLLAGLAWTSLFVLPAIRQPTLVIAGTDDPLVPIANARILSTLLPRATLHEHGGGHLDVLVNADVFGPVIEDFLGRDAR